MPEPCHENGHLKGSIPKNAENQHRVDTNQSTEETEEASSPRSSEESDDVPWPFDSDSSVNEEDAILGGERPRRNRLQLSDTIRRASQHVANSISTSFSYAFGVQRWLWRRCADNADHRIMQDAPSM